MSLLLLLLAVPSASLAADCVERVDVEAFSARIGEAETAFGELRVPDFFRATDEAAFLLECLGQPVSLDVAGRYHRLQGLRLYVAQDEEEAVLSFAAARSVAPGLTLPETLVPPGHELRELYARFPLENGKTWRVPRPAEGRLLFDGQESTERPTTWPTVVQLEDGSGQVTETAWLRPRDAMPAYRIAAMEPGGKARTPVKGALLGTGAVATIGAGFLYGLAAASAASFDQDHPDWTSEDLSRHRSRTNSLVLASAALGGAAVVTLGIGVALR